MRPTAARYCIPTALLAAPAILVLLFDPLREAPAALFFSFLFPLAAEVFGSEPIRLRERLSFMMATMLGSLAGFCVHSQLDLHPMHEHLLDGLITASAIGLASATHIESRLSPGAVLRTAIFGTAVAPTYALFYDPHRAGDPALWNALWYLPVGLLQLYEIRRASLRPDRSERAGCSLPRPLRICLVLSLAFGPPALYLASALLSIAGSYRGECLGWMMESWRAPLGECLISSLTGVTAIFELSLAVLWIALIAFSLLWKEDADLRALLIAPALYLYGTRISAIFLGPEIALTNGILFGLAFPFLLKLRGNKGLRAFDRLRYLCIASLAPIIGILAGGFVGVATGLGADDVLADPILVRFIEAGLIGLGAAHIVHVRLSLPGAIRISLAGAALSPLYIFVPSSGPLGDLVVRGAWESFWYVPIGAIVYLELRRARSQSDLQPAVPIPEEPSRESVVDPA